MATAWVNFNNGDTGFAVRTALNTFNTGISSDMANAETRLTDAEADISTNTSAISALDTRTTAAEASITDHETRLAHLEDTGMTVLSGVSIPPQTIAVTPTKVNLFTSVDIDVGVGTAGDATLDRATAETSGVFKLRFEAFVSYASNVTITWQIYKNGAPFGNAVDLDGQGANTFAVILISSAELLANDYLELYATASASTDVTVSQSNGSLEKTHY